MPKPQAPTRADARTQLAEAVAERVPRALKVLDSLMKKSKNDRVRLSAAENILDRVLPKVTRTETEDNTLRIVIAGDDLTRLVQGLAITRQVPVEALEAEFRELPAEPEEEAGPEPGRQTDLAQERESR